MFDKYRAVDITKMYMEKYAQLKKLNELAKCPEKITDEDLRLDSLLNIYIEPTNRCNLNCAFCARENMDRDYDMLDVESMKKTIDSLPQGSYITMTGNGEPTINVKLYEMITYASQKGMFVSLITNASLLNENNRKKLIESGVSRIQLSFQALDKKTNESLMQGSIFERELLNMLKLIRDIREKNAPIYISISRVDLPESAEFAEVTKKFWEKMPIDNYYEGKLLSLQNDSKMFKKVDEEYRPCADPWISLKIAANGSVAGCIQDFSCKYVMGNINEKPLGEIINSNEAIKFRKAMLIGDWDYLETIGYGGCRYCNTWQKSVNYNIEGAMQDSIPIRMGLVIDEISSERPENVDFLDKAIACLENGQVDLIHELMEED